MSCHDNSLATTFVSAQHAFEHFSGHRYRLRAIFASVEEISGLCPHHLWPCWYRQEILHLCWYPHRQRYSAVTQSTVPCTITGCGGWLSGTAAVGKSPEMAKLSLTSLSSLRDGSWFGSSKFSKPVKTRCPRTLSFSHLWVESRFLQHTVKTSAVIDPTVDSGMKSYRHQVYEIFCHISGDLRNRQVHL